MQPHLELQIDELVIDGLADIDRAQLGAAVQEELARLFTERGIPHNLQQNSTRLTLDGGTITVQPGAPSSVVGRQIAGSLYGGLQQ